MSVFRLGALSRRFVQRRGAARCIEAIVGVICILALINSAAAQGRDANSRTPAGGETNVLRFLWDAFRGVPVAFLAGLTPAIALPEQVGSATSKPVLPDVSKPPVALPERVVLYEEDPAHPKGLQYIGTVVWRLETIKRNGLPTKEIAVRGDIYIPARELKFTLSFQRNIDTSLPASHTMELTFVLPQDFVGGGIASVAGVLMKATEQARGTPLAGLAVKVTDGFFLVGFSNGESDRQRNLRLLRENGWFDIPVVYQNKRRAIIAINRGAPEIGRSRPRSIPGRAARPSRRHADIKPDLL